MTRFSALFLFAFFCLFLIGERALAQDGRSSRVRVAIVTDEADAVLSILAKKQSNQEITESDWQRVFASEGYARLKKRELAMKNSFEDTDFQSFVLSDALFERRQSLTNTLAKWKETNVERVAELPLAYLPKGANIHAKIYPVIKPGVNSFVFDVKTDPAIFLYLDPAVSREKFENTLAHELHHIGYSSNCPAKKVSDEISRLPENERAVIKLIGAFGEGFAMLAAAGSPDTHPHAVSNPEERARWDKDMANFNDDLKKVERFFLDLLENRLTDDEARKTYASFFGVQGPWYTVGWKMSVMIEKTFGRKKLIECICDQRKLLPTYNSAVGKYNGKYHETLSSWSPTLVKKLGLIPTVGRSQGKAQEIDSLMHKLAARGQFSGSILVSERGRVIFKSGFGTANAAKNIPFTADTPVYLASLTKQFTAMAIMMLKEKGKLSYDDTLSKYFPEFPAYANKITIRNLLNHTSGIPDYVDLGLEHAGLTDTDVLNALVKQSTPRFAAGEKFEYSNSGYILLAMIVEKVSGQPYALFLKQNIFRPLAMKNTFVRDRSEKLPEKIARGYNRFGNDDDYTLLTYGEGGIYSTVEDMYRWDRALAGEKLVRQSTLREAFLPAKLNDGTISNYGFGWGIATVNGGTTVSHAGRFGGFNTYIKRFLNSGNTIVFLTNSGFRNMGAIGNALINVHDGKPYQLPKLSVAEAVYRKYRSGGIDSALGFYADLKKKDDETYEFGESELNELGYEFLATNMINDAIEILKLNADAYPNSSNVYDGLGEAYMKNGDNELAIKNYKMSLKLDPSNANAAAMLKKLELK